MSRRCVCWSTGRDRGAAEALGHRDGPPPPWISGARGTCSPSRWVRSGCPTRDHRRAVAFPSRRRAPGGDSRSAPARRSGTDASSWCAGCDPRRRRSGPCGGSSDRWSSAAAGCPARPRPSRPFSGSTISFRPHHPFAWRVGVSWAAKWRYVLPSARDLSRDCWTSTRMSPLHRLRDGERGDVLLAEHVEVMEGRYLQVFTTEELQGLLRDRAGEGVSRLLGVVGGHG